MNKSMSRRQAGFSLIELMIVVVVLGILASIAWPSYVEHVRTSRRADAKSALQSAAQCLERFNTSNQTFVGGDARCPLPNSDFYNLSYANIARNTFTINAQPTGSQSTDYCGQLGINQAGVKTHQGGSSAKCW
jgi:type IV pilus assembly protein PilE